MNVRAQFYEEFADRLLNIKDTNGASVVKHVDLWNEQTGGDWQKPFNTPAVFLQFHDIPWKSVGGHKQAADSMVTLHIVSDVKHPTQAHTTFTDKALLHLEIIDIIHKWLTGWSAACSGSLSRTGSKQDHYFAELIEHEETYKVRLFDTSAMGNYQRVEGDKFIVELEV